MTFALTVFIKTIDKEQNHCMVTVPFCTGSVSFEYFDDLFGYEHYNQFINMVKNHMKPDHIETIKL